MGASGTSPTVWRVGIDVGGTFTDLVATNGTDVRVIKVPSTPPAFEQGVIAALTHLRAEIGDAAPVDIIHGSTVATNALLERKGQPVAFVTTEGFRDLLLIGRQNRPRLYALRVERPAPIVAEDNCFTVRERIGAHGDVVTPLEDTEVGRVVQAIRAKGLRHAAVCLLFSFANPEHERKLASALRAAGITVTLSSDLVPEFREYERASTTAINASMRPAVEKYLATLETELQARQGGASLQIMSSSGGTLPVREACESAAKLLLSGPAGGVIGAAFAAHSEGFENVVTYDMGGTSTDVATIVAGQPAWTTRTTIDGLPVGLPMFDIHTVGAGGGSIARLDPGGALRVGPESAGASPGPACYDRGGTLATVTDANVVLGRIVPGRFLGGAMPIRPDLADRAVATLAAAMNKSVVETALGIVRVAEANMRHAVRAVTARRGHDPRRFALVSFGGAGGLHACALADALEIPTVIVPPHCGALSALGMLVAQPVADAAKTVVQLGDDLDDHRLPAEFGYLSGVTQDRIPYAQTDRIEAYADVRFKGQSHELTVRVPNPTVGAIRDAFIAAYEQLYGRAPADRPIEIVTLRVRRFGRTPDLTFQTAAPNPETLAGRDARTFDEAGRSQTVPATGRGALPERGASGPRLLLDPGATVFVPSAWHVERRPTGALVLRHT